LARATPFQVNSSGFEGDLLVAIACPGREAAIDIVRTQLARTAVVPPDKGRTFYQRALEPTSGGS